MAAQNQDFEIYAGDSAVVTFLVTDQPNGTGCPVDLTACADIIVTVSRNLDDATATVLQKKLSTQGVTLVGAGTTPPTGKFSLLLFPTDTTGLTLAYAYLAVTLDDTGNPVTVASGQMKVRPKPTASFSGDPAQSNRDFVRSLVGDDNVDAPIYTDQVYDNLFSTFGGPLYVAAQVCRMLAMKYSGKVTKRVGDFSISNSDLAKNFRAMAADYQMQADLGGIPYIAGISKSDMQTYRPRENPDAVGCFTTVHAFDNRGGAYGGFMPPNEGGDGA